jgi:lincosamide nucleotidyltransferase A/C/D/E
MENPIPPQAPEMTAEDALAILQLFETNQIELHLDGGWGVDALLGQQTRPHADLDIVVQHKVVPRLRLLLETHGFKEIHRDDSWECNFVLENAHGHQVDVHSCTFDSAGNNIFGVAYPFDSLTGKGTINGHSVKCISPGWLVKFHTGYALDENDYHDVKLLCGAFNLPLPEDYNGFTESKSHNR